MSAAIRAHQVAKSFRIPLDRAATLKYRVTHPRSSSKYRQFDALREITFDVAEGEFLGIIGHNGCGKSTLLKILAGIYQPTSGRVEVTGRVSPFLELGVGFNPELTARENVFLSGSVLGLTRRELVERVDGILAFAEIEDFAQTKLKNFSSGMQVRLAFSVAIQADAGILLMDEVLAVGDAAFAEKCFDVFARYKREGRTIVLVTHDLASVQSYCDRVLLIDHGSLIMDGSPADVTARYRRMVGAQSDHADIHEIPGGAGPDPDASDSPEGMARWGSREVAITRVRLLNGDGGEHSTFTTGEPLTVEVSFVVHDDQAGAFICGLAFERVDGLNVAGPNSGITGQVLECPPTGSRGVVRYSIESLPFLGAAYYLTAALYDQHASHALDHIQRLKTFRVSDDRGRAGLVDPGGRWEFDVEGAAFAASARVAG
ncbi:MAG: ABC transporter ATP-binding protein [Candidatus Dormibacteria bacterium]